MNRFEMKIFKKIYGPKNDNGERRIRYNHDLYKLYKEPLLTTLIYKANATDGSCTTYARGWSGKKDIPETTSVKTPDWWTKSKMGR